MGRPEAPCRFPLAAACWRQGYGRGQGRAEGVAGKIQNGAGDRQGLFSMPACSGAGARMEQTRGDASCIFGQRPAGTPGAGAPEGSKQSARMLSCEGDPGPILARSCPCRNRDRSEPGVRRVCPVGKVRLIGRGRPVGEQVAGSPARLAAPVMQVCIGSGTGSLSSGGSVIMRSSAWG